MDKVVAYLDILGFSDAVFNSVDDAVMTLTSFNTILHTGIMDSRLHPSANVDPQIKVLAKRCSIESFEDFLPFSDSVFATSRDCSDFVMQLGHFVYSSFHFAAHIYADATNPDDPTATTSIGVDRDSNGNPVIVHRPYHQPPVLFRGGLAYGDVVDLKPIAIVAGQSQSIITLAGEAVVRAVRLERGLKGPRLSFGQELYDQLNETARKYCRVVPECDEEHKRYEILWPAMGYITENMYNQEFSHFMDLFQPAYNLWLPHRKSCNEKVEIHYRKFIELIIVSALQVYDEFWNCRSFALEKIKAILESKGALSEFVQLLHG